MTIVAGIKFDFTWDQQLVPKLQIFSVVFYGYCQSHKRVATVIDRSMDLALTKILLDPACHY